MQFLNNSFKEFLTFIGLNWYQLYHIDIISRGVACPRKSGKTSTRVTPIN